MTSENSSSLAKSLGRAGGTAVVLFGGEWNPATRAVRTHLEEGSLPENAQLICVDVDDDTAAAAYADVRCVPTIQIWKGGEKVAVNEYVRPDAELTSWLKTAI